MSQHRWESEKALEAQRVTPEEMQAIIDLWSRERGGRESVDAHSSISDVAEGLEISTAETLRLLERVRAERALEQERRQEERRAQEAAAQAAREHLEARARLAEAEARLAEAEARRARAEAQRRHAEQSPVPITPIVQQSSVQQSSEQTGQSRSMALILLIVGGLILLVLTFATGTSRPTNPNAPCGDGMTSVRLDGKELPCGDPRRRSIQEKIRPQSPPTFPR